MAWSRGTADSLLLSVLPVLPTRHALAGRVRSGGPGRRGAAAGVALASGLAVTAAYHIGYPEYRGTRLVSPLIGNAVLSLAYVVSDHPIATIGPHVAMHIAAVLHGPDTALQLPPHDSRR